MYFRARPSAGCPAPRGAVNHRTRAHEQQRLEERVRDQMEHPHRHAAHAKPHHHVAKLRNSRVSQNALDVVLRDRDQRGKDRGDAPTHVTTVSAVVVPPASASRAAISG